LFKFIKHAKQKALGLLGNQNQPNDFAFPVEMSQDDIELVQHVLVNKLSMVSIEGLCSTLMAAKYVAKNQIPGDFVECGVWRGGNSIIAAEIFKRYNIDKKIYLFDTFLGMTAPTVVDRQQSDGKPALEQFLQADKGGYNEWCFATESEVRSNFATTNTLSDNVVFVKGPVEDTLKVEQNLPDRICFLRLDTDWYESTLIELKILYPRLSQGGCLIIDDYGYWSGSRKATDEYFESLGESPLLHVTDNTRRVAVKV
jgi:O-methyltransferase